MKNPFGKEIKHITMNARERHDLRERIVSYMEYHPLRMPEPHARLSFSYYALRVIRTVSEHVGRRQVVAACAVLFFIAVPVAAERSLPGDTLYPVKVRFNEGVRSQLTFSPYERMQWETKRVERRLSEARLLAESGDLTEEKEQALSQTVLEHTTAFQKELATLRATDAEGAVVAEVALESALDVQTALLDTDLALAASSTVVNEGSVHDLADVVRTARNDVSAVSNASTTPSYERLMARVEENTTRIFALRESIGGELSLEEQAQLDERSQTVDENVLAAKAAHERGEYNEAAEILREALATTEKLIAFLNSLDVRSRVSLDTLIPKKEKSIESTYAALVESRTRFGETLTVLVEPEQTEVTRMLAELDAILTTIGDAITSDELDEAKRLLSEAEILFNEIKVKVGGGEVLGTTTTEGI